MHPVPWLLLLGIPFALYQVAFSPLRSMWLWMFAGVGLGAVLVFLYETMSAARVRRMRADTAGESHS
jgi:hypothetical protein